MVKLTRQELSVWSVNKCDTNNNNTGGSCHVGWVSSVSSVAWSLGNSFYLSLFELISMFYFLLNISLQTKHEFISGFLYVFSRKSKSIKEFGNSN